MLTAVFGKYAFLVVLALVSGVASSIIAKTKGRDPAMWFIAGIIFNLVSVGTISIMSRK